MHAESGQSERVFISHGQQWKYLYMRIEDTVQYNGTMPGNRTGQHRGINIGVNASRRYANVR